MDFKKSMKSNHRRIPALLLISSLLWTAIGCVAPPPEGLEPVSEFEPERYLGTWYEIARLDNPMEQGLSHVTCEYASCSCSGKMIITNRAWNQNARKWQIARGFAEYLASDRTASMKVTFNWPVFSPYYIIDLDQEFYTWALVTSDSYDSLWILARKPEIRDELLGELLAKAEQWGFETDKLVFVAHN